MHAPWRQPAFNDRSMWGTNVWSPHHNSEQLWRANPTPELLLMGQLRLSLELCHSPTSSLNQYCLFSLDLRCWSQRHPSKLPMRDLQQPSRGNPQAGFMAYVSSESASGKPPFQMIPGTAIVPRALVTVHRPYSQLHSLFISLSPTPISLSFFLSNPFETK